MFALTSAPLPPIDPDPDDVSNFRFPIVGLSPRRSNSRSIGYEIVVCEQTAELSAACPPALQLPTRRGLLQLPRPLPFLLPNAAAVAPRLTEDDLLSELV
ncbi:hypothetical protein Dda_4633 [Drechslerella dactyloides]|uniref:Uncharacterized protein n=1 Tax=Drechslerella dactyloides TaxID=74499 RepID=A0AAD6NJF3_DREDA|nr:hypothetical protein Dda_4633 [Drechslerella dactyloides]